MIIDTSPWLSDPELIRLFDVLEPIGELRFIGGAVRDAVLGLPHSDIDLATRALPGEVMKVARKAGFRVIPTGLDHGTVTIVLPRGPVEITTLRCDVATDGRHAEIAFTDDWQVDAARRDFTINALSADRNGVVHDYFDGLDDLAGRRVRFIGNPVVRIREDYLRILRFFRFSGRYAERLDSHAVEAIRSNVADMTRLSGERILSEVLKLLALPRSPEMWQAMIECGVVDATLPAARDVGRLGELTALEESFLTLPVGEVERVKLVRVRGLPQSQLAPHPSPLPYGEGVISADAFLRLMALLPSPVPNVNAVAKKLKLSTAQKTRLMQSTFSAARLACLEAGDWAHVLYGVDPQTIVDAALLQAASGLLSLEKLESLLAFTETWEAPKFPLGGDNLMELGLKPGPIFGALLREIEQWWIEQDFQPTRQQCFAELKRVWFERKKKNGAY